MKMNRSCVLQFPVFLIILQVLVTTICLLIYKFGHGDEAAKKIQTKFKIMSQLIVQICKLLRTALKTKARVVKVDYDLLHIVLQVNQSKICHWNPRQKTV